MISYLLEGISSLPKLDDSRLDVVKDGSTKLHSLSDQL